MKQLNSLQYIKKYGFLFYVQKSLTVLDIANLKTLANMLNFSFFKFPTNLNTFFINFNNCFLFTFDFLHSNFFSDFFHIFDYISFILDFKQVQFLSFKFSVNFILYPSLFQLFNNPFLQNFKKFELITNKKNYSYIHSFFTSINKFSSFFFFLKYLYL